MSNTAPAMRAADLAADIFAFKPRTLPSVGNWTPKAPYVAPVQADILLAKAIVPSLEGKDAPAHQKAVYTAVLRLLSLLAKNCSFPINREDGMARAEAIADILNLGGIDVLTIETFRKIELDAIRKFSKMPSSAEVVDLIEMHQKVLRGRMAYVRHLAAMEARKERTSEDLDAEEARFSAQFEREWGYKAPVA